MKKVDLTNGKKTISFSIEQAENILKIESAKVPRQKKNWFIPEKDKDKVQFIDGKIRISTKSTSKD